MAQLAILQYPDPRLTRTAEIVTRFDASLRELAQSMIETLRASGGIGLAAPQVGVNLRVFVADVSESRDATRVFVNPTIVERAAPGMVEESCLSVPGVMEVVPRALRLRVSALDADGRPFDLDADGILAACVQHEIDHLDGRLFIDRLSWLKRSGVRRRLKRLASA